PIPSASSGGIPTLVSLVLLWIACQISSSSFSFLLSLQIPAGEDPSEPIPFVLKNQPSTAIRYPIQNVDITKAMFIPTKGVLVEKAFLGLIRLNAVIPQMLDVSVFLPFIIPFELVPVISSHESVTRHFRERFRAQHVKSRYRSVPTTPRGRR
ncbi:MAG: hypothetical protein Q8P17_04695, partial [bacterium]|nr:hypothetical protein [bacterium]